MRITVNIICGLALALVLCCCKDSRSIETPEGSSQVLIGVDFDSKAPAADVTEENAMNDFRMFIFRSTSPATFRSMLAQVYGSTTDKLYASVLEGPVMLAMLSNERSEWKLPRTDPYSSMSIDEIRGLKLDFLTDYPTKLITPPFVMYKESSKTDILKSVLNGGLSTMRFSNDADVSKPFQEKGLDRMVAKVTISIKCDYADFPGGYKIDLTKLSVCNMPGQPYVGRNMTYDGALFDGNEIPLKSPSKHMNYQSTGFSTVGAGDAKDEIELYIPEHIILDADRYNRYTYLKIEGTVIGESIEFVRYLPIGNGVGKLPTTGGTGQEGVDALDAADLTISRNNLYKYRVRFTNLKEFPIILIEGVTVNAWLEGAPIEGEVK